MNSKKKPLRPIQSADKFFDAIERSQDSFLLDAKQMEDSLSTRQFLPLPINKIITSITNTRTLPINFDRFMLINWPKVNDSAYRAKLRAIVNSEDIDSKYTKLTALRFYEKVYLLAKDILVTGLSQPIGVIEVSRHEYALVWGQRRFMASWLASLTMVDSIIIETEIGNTRLIAHIQDSENDLKDDPVLVDRIEAKRKKWVEYTAKTARVINRELYDFMGVNRTDGAVLVRLFNSIYEVEYLDMIRESQLTSFGSLRTLDFDVDPLLKKEPKAIPASNKNKAPALRVMGISLDKRCEVNLLKFLVETAIKSGEFSETVLNKLSGVDLSSRDDLSNALRLVADTIYAK